MFKVHVERLKVVAVFIPELVQIHGYVTCVVTQGTKVRGFPLYSAVAILQFLTVL